MIDIAHTPEGAAAIDVALCAIGKARPGDVLVIRYGYYATRLMASEFTDAICRAVRALPPEVRKSIPTLPIVIAPEGVSWELCATPKARAEEKDA